QEQHALAIDALPEGKVRVRSPRKQLVEAARVHDGARERVLAEVLGLFENADRDLPQTASGLVALAHELRQLDRAGQARRAAPDEQHVDLQRLASCSVR